MHLSTVHHRGDIRIALKQAETLAATFRGRVELVVADGLGPSEREGVTIFDLGVLGPNRLTRAILGFARSVGHLRAVRPAVGGDDGGQLIQAMLEILLRIWKPRISELM